MFDKADGFPSDREKALRRGFIEIPPQRELKLELTGLAPGSYAVALFHDQDENGKLNKGFMGIPRESIGFSRNPKVQFGPPRFDEASVNIEGQAVNLEVKMLN